MAQRSVIVLGDLGGESPTPLEIVQRETEFQYKVTETADEAIEMLGEDDLAAVLFDMMAPGAERLCQKARARRPILAVPLIAIARRLNDLTFSNVFRWGADDAVSIFDSDPLIDRLNAIKDLSPDTPPKSRGEAVVADPDQSRRDVLSRVLASAGYIPKSAADALSVRFFISRPKVSLVVINAESTNVRKLITETREKGNKAAWIVTCKPRDLSRVTAELRMENVATISANGPPENVLFLANEMQAEINNDVPELRTEPRALYGAVVAFRAEGADQDDVGFTYNVSATGMFVRTLTTLRADRLWMELRPPKADRRIRVTADVIWRRGFGSMGEQIAPPGFAVRIVDGLPADLKLWTEGFQAICIEQGRATARRPGAAAAALVSSSPEPRGERASQINLEQEADQVADMVFNALKSDEAPAAASPAGRVRLPIPPGVGAARKMTPMPMPAAKPLAKDKTPTKPAAAKTPEIAKSKQGQKPSKPDEKKGKEAPEAATGDKKPQAARFVDDFVDKQFEQKVEEKNAASSKVTPAEPPEKPPEANATGDKKTPVVAAPDKPDKKAPTPAAPEKKPAVAEKTSAVADAAEKKKSPVAAAPKKPAALDKEKLGFGKTVLGIGMGGAPKPPAKPVEVAAGLKAQPPAKPSVEELDSSDLDSVPPSTRESAPSPSAVSLAPDDAASLPPSIKAASQAEPAGVAKPPAQPESAFANTVLHAAPPPADAAHLASLESTQSNANTSFDTDALEITQPKSGVGKIVAIAAAVLAVGAGIAFVTLQTESPAAPEKQTAEKPVQESEPTPVTAAPKPESSAAEPAPTDEPKPEPKPQEKSQAAPEQEPKPEPAAAEEAPTAEEPKEETPEEPAAATPTPDGTQLPANQGYVLVHSAKSEAQVFVHGVLAGPVNQAVPATCGPRFIRLGTEPGKWLGEGRMAVIKCQDFTELKF